MDEHKEAVIDFILEHRVIEFGKYRLKSNRLSPYMINTGNVDTGAGLIELSRFYACVIRNQIGIENADIIFGPAYKGIPLCTSTAEQLTVERPDIGFLYDRKEEKRYAEGRDGIRGKVIGKIPKPGDSIVIVDDVLTSGHTKRQCIDLLLQIESQATIAGLIIAVDRQEVDTEGADAVAAFTHYTGVPVYPLVTITGIMDRLTKKGLDEQRASIQAYLNNHGITSVQE